MKRSRNLKTEPVLFIPVHVYTYVKQLYFLARLG